MSSVIDIAPAVRALCARFGTLAQPGQLTKGAPAWVLRPMGIAGDTSDSGDTAAELWLTVWISTPCADGDGDDGTAPAPHTLHVAGLLCPTPERRPDQDVRSWMLRRNVQHRLVTISIRRVPPSVDETARPNLWAEGALPVRGEVADLEADLAAIVAAIEAAATHARRRMSQIAAKRAMVRAAKERLARRSEVAVTAPTGADLATVLAELDAMTGLAEVKSLVRALVSQHRFAALREARGLRNAVMSPNLVFTGNPGTGKTTVARLVAQAYAAIGLLPKGHLVEVDRSDLVAKYVGQSAIKTKDACEKALGGVLFIDEAYSLENESAVDYGAEVVATLMTFMESHRGEFAVIVAGYPREMESFMKMNPGLQSRFDTAVHFPDYDDDDLTAILLGYFASHDYVVAGETKERLAARIASLRRGRGFGNARAMRTLFGDVLRSHAQLAMASDGQVDETRLTVIHPSAVPNPVATAATQVTSPGGVYL